MELQASSRRRSRLRLRLAALFLLSVCVSAPLLAPFGAAGSVGAQSAQTAIELGTLDEINSVRAAHALPPLTFSRGLFASASVHDRQMVAGGYFGHQAPNGSDFTRRVEAYYPPGRALYYSIGENLFSTQGTVSSGQLVTRWLHSPEHRANLLSPRWSQVAIAVLTVPEAPGVFGGRPVTVVTVDFGVRT